MRRDTAYLLNMDLQAASVSIYEPMPSADVIKSSEQAIANLGGTAVCPSHWGGFLFVKYK
jgi:hypothetical protein